MKHKLDEGFKILTITVIALVSLVCIQAILTRP